MMKKPPGLWLLLSAGVLWLCFQDVSCVRATSLIFGKSTTTTTTTSPSEASDSSSAAPSASRSSSGDEENTSDSPSGGTNSSKPVLTGIPQVDYQWDPNLPRELNGFNLTDYPFYDRLPEDIDFKCDGLHDGFYASVPHKCQVYHHCLFGTRYDFLCANYTAFDQKTFICHFVSEVDCVNSKKFWHRNDALYQAASTTTIKPLIVYTPPPPPAILSGGTGAGGGRRQQNQAPVPRRRKPARRRRPQYDYYDDYEEDEEEYYDEPRYTATEPPRSEGRRRKQRPRPRPRPIYDDEYEEYEDERYDRRRGSSRRGEDERRYRNRPSSRRNKEERRKYEDEYEEYEDEDPRFDRSDERRNKKPKDDRRRPAADEKRSDERKRDEKRPSDDRMRYDKRRQDEEDMEEKRPRPRKGQRRPVDDDYEVEERRPSKRKEELPSAPAEDKPLVKPAGTSVYDRPRVAPRIRPPVPKNEADKYAYKTTAGPPASKASKGQDEEYYDDYEEEVPKKRPAKDSQADASITSNSRKTSTTSKNYRDETRRNPRPPKISRRPPDDEYIYEDEEERPRRAQKPKNEERRVGQGSRKRPATSQDYDDDYEDIPRTRDAVSKMKGRERDKEKEAEKVTTPVSVTTTRRKYGNKDLFRTTKMTTTTTTSTTTTTTTTTPAPLPSSPAPTNSKEESPAGNYKSVRIVKRPFLPSRGGNPYIGRGLQPIGLKSESQNTQESRKHPEEVKEVEEEIAKPAKVSKRPQDIVIENYRTPNNRPNFKNQYQTQTSKPIEKNPLDINENEYDVTLNDALNPTLPNLPLRQFPSGFSNNVNNEYTFNAFHRPRYVVDATINQAGSEYQYRFKQPQVQQPASQTNVRFESKQTNGHGPQHQQSRQSENQDFTGQYSTNYQHFRPSPRVTHTQAFYAAF